MNIADVLCTNYGTKSWKLTSPDDYSALEWYDASEKRKIISDCPVCPPQINLHRLRTAGL